MSVKRLKPDHATTIPVTLAARTQVSPSFLRLTVTGEGLDSYRPMGADQWFRLFLPTGGGGSAAAGAAGSAGTAHGGGGAGGGVGEPRTLPDMSLRSIATYTLTRPSRRPLIRNYTTVDFRPADPDAGRATAELDFDVYVDDSHEGPGLTWAREAQLGSAAALLDEGRLYAPPEDSTRELLVGDESALPALAGILSGAPESMTGLVVVELGNTADIRDLPRPTGVEVMWTERGDDEPGVGALAEVRRRGAPADLTYAYLAGPSSMVTGLRRFLVRDCGVAKDLVSFTGYWR